LKEYKWIADRCGTCEEKDIDSIIGEYSLEKADRIAFHSNELGVKARIENLRWLLELRVFEEDRELRFLRHTLGGEFAWRVAQDKFDDENTYSFPEEHLLDRTKRPIDGNYYKSTAGGVYELPRRGYKKVLLVNYFTFDEETGNLQFADFRIKGFSY